MKPWMPALLVLPLLGACAEDHPTSDARARAAWSSIENWSADSKKAAERMMDRYGPPDHLDAGRLVWFRTGSWKRVEVWDFAESPDVIEETVSYNIPAGKRAPLTAFSDKLAVSQDGSELSVRGPNEAENFLTMNLAAEIIKGYTTPAEARKSFAQTMDLRASGKSASFTEGLRFPPPEP